MEQFWVIALVIAAGLLALAKTAINFGKDGQKEYESAEIAARERGKSIKASEAIKPDPEPTQELLQPMKAFRPDAGKNKPFMDFSDKTRQWQTILDIPTIDGPPIQVAGQGRTLYISDWLRQVVSDIHELPGEYLDYQVVRVGPQSRWVAFLVVLCKSARGKKSLDVVGVRKPGKDFQGCRFEPIRATFTDCETIGHIFLNECNEPCGVVLLSGSGTGLERIDFDKGLRVSVDFGKIVAIDGRCAIDGEFWLYDGDGLQRWAIEDYGIKMLDSVNLPGEVSGQIFQPTRAIMPDKTPPVICNGNVAYSTATGESLKIEGVRECIGGSLFIADDGLHFGSFSKGRVVRMLDVKVNCLFLANLYEEADSFWAFFLNQQEKSEGYLVIVVGEAANLIKIDGFNGDIMDATMDLETEKIVIYTDSETAITGNLHLLRSQEFALCDGIFGGDHEPHDIPKDFAVQIDSQKL